MLSWSNHWDMNLTDGQTVFSKVQCGDPIVWPHQPHSSAPASITSLVKLLRIKKNKSFNLWKPKCKCKAKCGLSTFFMYLFQYVIKANCTFCLPVYPTVVPGPCWLVVVVVEFVVEFVVELVVMSVDLLKWGSSAFVIVEYFPEFSNKHGPFL